jgi:enoyl-CoA hydratase
MGPTRLRLKRPVIAAIEGYAVAGGLELAAWCDLRVASEHAVLGVFCRRIGVPLVDLGTIRLPRLIGHSRAMDLTLTGRGIEATEAYAMDSSTASSLTQPRSNSPQPLEREIIDTRSREAREQLHE